MPVVVNRHHYKDGEFPEPYLYVGRGTAFELNFTRDYLLRVVESNPALKARVKDDPHAIFHPYKVELFNRIKSKEPAIIRALSLIRDDSHLGCGCVKEDGSGLCHANIVKGAWEWWRSNGSPGLVVAVVGSKSWPVKKIVPQFAQLYPELLSLIATIPSQAKYIARNVEGIDRAVIEYAKACGNEAAFVEVDREANGKGAEFKRDSELIEKAHWLFAFDNGSSGTGRIVQLAKAAGLPHMVYTIEKETPEGEERK